MDALGDRMKQYEKLGEGHLMRRIPVVGRLDGKAFHTFTKNMQRPWDERLVRTMWSAATYLCENIEGCQIAYVQSDEITVLLTDWHTYNTQSWYNYRVQKMASVGAAMCATAFYRAMLEEFPAQEVPSRLPAFDARFWNLPRHEVTNAFIWRQQDATRNSVQMLGRAHFSHKQMEFKSNSDIQDMLMLKGINWNDSPTWAKRGACIVKSVEHSPDGKQRSTWKVDTETPIFTQDRDYIEKHLPEVFWKEHLC